jgi:cholera toxin transcriptional activator
MLIPPASPAARLIRFGVFEVDLAAGELRKNGSRVRLQEQPFQLLHLLVERPSEIVTREELRQKLWPADTFVDFDHSLNTAVNKLRDALGDSAASPRYIETLARRGYRFVAPVERLEGRGAVQAAATADVNGPRGHRRLVHPELEVPLPHRGLVRFLFALIQVMYLCFYLAALLHLQQVGRIADSFFAAWAAFAVTVLVLVSGGVGILLRCYLFSAVAFDYRRLLQKFKQLFLLVLLLDELWALAPFLLTQKMGLGAAFAVTAALLYVPFSERTLLRLAEPAAVGPEM